MLLPQPFCERMQQLLKKEYELFLQTYSQDKHQGLRINPLKIEKQTFLALSPFPLHPIPWAEEGFYYPADVRPGKHPYFEAGLYYIQEPSAMAAVDFLAPQPGEKILDLCAAPGGKSTHIAGNMRGEGLLVANEIHPARVKILSQNIERMGVPNAVVTNETPDRLASRFPEFFDRILVDAPCSGEGMFRKDPQACEEWSLENVKMCAARQLDILKEAAKMLRPGGRMVYSTCTFAPLENEGTVSRFLEFCPEMEIFSAGCHPIFSKGVPEWTEQPANGIEHTARLWPHRLEGEGHFIAALQKQGETKPYKRQYPHPLQAVPKEFLSFAENNLNIAFDGNFSLFGDNLYLTPKEMLAIDGIKTVRPGLHLGTVKRNRFVPSHALALSLKREQAKRSLAFPADSAEIHSYLKGDTIPWNGEKGWTLVTVDGYSLGWGKCSDATLKNHYPKGLRWLTL